MNTSEAAGMGVIYSILLIVGVALAIAWIFFPFILFGKLNQLNKTVQAILAAMPVASQQPPICEPQEAQPLISETQAQEEPVLPRALPTGELAVSKPEGW